MSSMTKISLLALIGTAAAVPQYGHGGHSKFHSLKSSSSAKLAYPTGGWGGANSTRVPQATGTGAYHDDKTTTLPTVLTSVHHITSTIYGAGPSSAPVVVEYDVSSGADQCGATKTVTEHEKVYVTITPSVGVPGSAPPAAASSHFGPGYEVPASSKVVGSSAPPAASSKVVVSSTPVAVSSKGVYSPPAEVNSKVSEYAVPSSKTPVAQASSSVVSKASSTVISSAAAKPTGSAPTYSGTKRGLAYNDATLCKSFGGSSFGFAYNWGQAEGKDIGTPFVPMMHKPQDSTPEAWLANVAKAAKAGTKAVMGFNEPDHVDQANLTPEAACSAWTKYMNPIASAHSDITIIGPSVTNGPAPMGLDWLHRFHSACPDAVVHATNIHFYDIPSDETINRFKAQIQKAADEYKKPVWVTEFGLNVGSASPKQAADFLKAAMEYMDGSDLVQGYSYFMVGEGETMLNAGSTVGQAYASSSY